MLIIDIALGIILALITLAIAPFALVWLFGLLAKLIVALDKPRTQISHGTGRQWWITGALQVGGVFGALLVLGLLSRWAHP
jgi:hypothetical protein